MISAFKKSTFENKNHQTAEKRALLVDRGSVLTTYRSVKHVSCTSALRGITVSIISFTKT